MHSRPPASALVSGGVGAGSALSGGDREVWYAREVDLGQPLLDLGRIDIRQLVERRVASGSNVDCSVGWKAQDTEQSARE